MDKKEKSINSHIDKAIGYSDNSNCQYKNSRDLCGEDYCGTKYWSPKLEE